MAPCRTHSYEVALARTHEVVRDNHRLEDRVEAVERRSHDRQDILHDEVVVVRSGLRAHGRRSNLLGVVACDDDTRRDEDCSHVVGRDDRSSHPEVVHRIHVRHDSHLENANDSAHADVGSRIEAKVVNDTCIS